jgi:hypothetical protein
MKLIIETKDKAEINRLVKSEDMACFIWELVHNGWREFKHTEYDYGPAWDKINSLLKEYDIDIDKLID